MADEIYLIDGSAFIYRAFHAVAPLTNAEGFQTNAVFGFVSMLNKLLKDKAPSHLAVAFDSRGKVFRHQMYPEYKANRPPMPDDLRDQIEPLVDAVRAMGLPLLRIEGVEADDVIGTLARLGAEAGMHVLMSTGDKDMAQLVNRHVSLVNTMSQTSLDEAGVEEKFGVTPGQIIDYLALMGDSSDNIPGVPKVGPKTAAKWLGTYGTLDNLIANADAIKGKVGESLREHLEQLPLSRELTTIRSDLELDTAPADLRVQAADKEQLRTLYTDLEFIRLLEELDSDTGDALASTGSESGADYQTVLTQAQLDDWLARLQQAGVFAFDTETTSIDYMEARIVGVSFAVNAHEAAYVPLAHDYPGAPDQLDRDAVLVQLKPLLENKDLSKIGHHIKYDRNVLANHGIVLDGMAYDSMLESYVLASTAVRHDMDSVALKYLGHTNIKYADVAGKGAKQLSFNEVPVETAAPYAAEDADITAVIAQCPGLDHDADGKLFIDREGMVMDAWYGYDKKKTEEAVKELKLDKP